MKRVLALVLSFIMILSMFPATALAEGTDETIVDEPVAEEPAADEPVADESAADESAAEENTEEPADECQHSYEAAVVQPTCTEAGYTVYTCSLCGSSYTADEIAASGHSWKETERLADPTCTEAGAAMFTCEVCTVSEQQEIAALGHTPVVDEAVAPTETTTGLTEGSHCDVCGEVIVAQEVIPVLVAEEGLSEELSNAASTGKCGVNVTYTIVDEVMTISGSGEMYDFTAENPAPWKDNAAITTVIIEEGVSTIGDYAFEGCSGLASLTMPKTVMSIGEGAFSGAGLVSLTLGEGVNLLDPMAFKDSNITDIGVNNGNATYYADGGVLFSKAKDVIVYYPAARNATTYSVPSYVTTIGEYAFYGAKSLTTITLHDAVTTINSHAFAETELNDMTIPRKVSSIKLQAFAGSKLNNLTVSTDNVTYMAQDGVLYSKDGKTILWYPDCNTGDAEGNFSIPDVTVTTSSGTETVQVTTVAEQAFYGTNLKSVTFPASITTVRSAIFKDSSALEEIYFMGKRPSINSSAFETLDAIVAKYWSMYSSSWNISTTNPPQYGGENITWSIIDEENVANNIGRQQFDENGDPILDDDNNPVYDEVYWEYYSQGKMLKITGTGAMKDFADDQSDLPWSGKDIENVYFENGITHIGDYSFDGFTAIRSITLPAKGSALTIGAYAFAEAAVASVELPSHLIEIGAGAFYGCAGIKTLKLPGKLTLIDDSAFYGCTALESFNLPLTVTEIGDEAFAGCTALKTVTVSESSTYVLTDIGASAFQGCEKLESFYLPSSIVNIGSYAFQGCKKLTGVTLRSKIETIGEYAFAGCEAITTISIPQKAVFGVGAFAGCTALTTVTVNASTTYTKEISMDAFSGCTELTKVTINNGVTGIGDGAFKDCAKLSALTVAATVTAIDPNAFTGCVGLKTAGTSSASNYYYRWTKDIPDYAFSNLTALTTVEIYSGIENIASSAFDGCTALTDINVLGSGTAGSFRSIDGVLCAKVDDTTNTDLTLYKYPAGRADKEYVVPDGIKSVTGIMQNKVIGIDDGAFRDNLYLTSVTFGENIKTVGSGVFENNAAIKAVKFIGDAPSIDSQAFMDVVDGTLYYISTKEGWTSEVVGTVYGAEGTTAWSGTSYVIEIDKPQDLKLVSGKSYTVNFRVRPINLIVSGSPFSVSLTGAGASYLETDVQWNTDDNVGTIKLTAKELDESKPVTVTLQSNDASVAADSFDITVIPHVETVTMFLDADEDGVPDDDEIYAESGRGTKTIATDKLDYYDDGYKFILKAAAFPADAIQDVEWTSSSSDVALIKVNDDGTATVTLRELGEVNITAKSKENSKISATVKLDVFFLDKSEELTAKTDAPSYGLPVDKTAQISVYGADSTKALDYHKFEYTVYGSSYIEVDENGLITAKKPGSASVSIVPKGKDPFERSTSVSVKVIDAQIDEVKLVPGIPLTDNYILKYRDENGNETDANNAASYVIEIDRNSTTGKELLKGGYKFDIDPILRANGVYIPETNKNIKYTSSNTAIATVALNRNGTATVTIKENANGACTITGAATDAAKEEGYLSIYVVDYAPRLDATKLTVNPYMTEGTSALLLSSYGSEVIESSLQLYEYNSDTKEYDIPLTDLAVTYDSGTETVSVKATDGAYDTMKNRTVKAMLKVSATRDAGNPLATVDYELPLSITIKASLPSVTVKQQEKIDLFYNNTFAPVTVTARDAEVKSVNIWAYKNPKDSGPYVDHEHFVVKDAYDVVPDAFTVEPNAAYFTDIAPDPKAKPVTKATLEIVLDGYRVPVEKTFTVGTTKSKLKITTKPTSSSVNIALGDTEVAFSLYNSTAKADLDLTGAEVAGLDEFFAESGRVNVVDDTVKLNIAGIEKSTTAKLSVKASDWAAPIELTHKVNVQKNEPAVKLSTSTLKLNNQYVDQTAEADVTLNQANIGIKDITFVPKVKSDALVEANKLIVDYVDGKVKVSINPAFKDLDKTDDTDDVPKKGTYTFEGTIVLENDYELAKKISVKVSVLDTIPKVTLGSTSVSLNQKLEAKNETAFSLAKLSKKDMEAGYVVVDFKEIREGWTHKFVNLSFADGELMADLKPLSDIYKEEYAKSYSFTLTPIVEDSQGTEVEVKPVKLTVKTYSSINNAWKAAVSGKGKLDTTQRDWDENKIVYTVSRLTNVTGKVKSVELVNRFDGGRFIMSPVEYNTKGQATVALTLMDGMIYSTDKEYTVQLALTMEGMTDGFKVYTEYLSVKVGQTDAKVKAKTVQGNIYQSQSSAIPAKYELTMTAPEYGSIADVTLNTESTPRQVLNAIGRTYDSGLDKYVWNDINWTPESDKSGMVTVTLRDTSKLVAGKSYTVYVDVVPTGNASDVDPVKVKLTLKVPR